MSLNLLHKLLLTLNFKTILLNESAYSRGLFNSCQRKNFMLCNKHLDISHYCGKGEMPVWDFSTNLCAKLERIKLCVCTQKVVNPTHQLYLKIGAKALVSYFLGDDTYCKM